MSRFELPEDWVKGLLEQAVTVKSGVGFPHKFQGKLTGDFPVYKVGDLSKAVLENDGYLCRAGNYVNTDEISQLKGEVFPKGSTLFAKIGEAVKLNRRAYVEVEGLADNNVMSVVPVIEQSKRFIYYFLKTVDLTDVSRSTTVPSIRKGDIEQLPIHWPSLAEQKVIADKLDTLLAQVESIKARLERIPEILKQFRQSVLAAAVSGKLTEEWRDINGLDGSYKIVENIPFETPTVWSFQRLEQITSRVTYGLTKRPAYVSDGVAVISAKEIRTGFVNFEVASHISESDFDGLREKCKIFPGDLLFSKTGSIGHVAIYDAEFQSASSQNIAVITPLLNLVMCQFLYYYLRSPFIQELAQSSVKANAIPDLQLGIISKFPIQLPLLAEQKVIVDKVESIFSTIDGIEQQAKSALDRVNNLTQSILAKAFRGELTAEWREANPELISGENSAKALLERIKAEHASVKPATKRGRGKA